MKLINNSLLLIVFLLLTIGLNAQDYGNFPYTQSFTSGIQPAEITIPENSDAVSFTNQGMVLTPAINTRFGAAYLNNIRFYSPQGIRLEFEYGMYGGTGADGLSVFLFDATVADPQIGSKGDGLAYNYNRANNFHVNERQAGLTGAYLGIGLDAFGNFKNNVFQGERRKNGLSTILTNIGNQVTLRGAAGKTSLGNDGRGLGFNGYPLLVTKSTKSGSNSGAVLNTNGSYSLTSGTTANFDLGTTTLGLTPSNANYRKAYIDLLPNVGGGYNVTVKIQHGTTITTIIDNYHYRTSLTYIENANPNSTDFSFSETQGADSTHTLDATIPEYFRIGFGASTGGFNNTHLIRNLKIMIPYAAEANDDTFEVNCTNNSVNVLANDLAYTNFSAPTPSTNNIYKPSFRFINDAGDAQGHTYADPLVGTWTYNQTTGIVSLTPLASFAGTATIQYDIKGGGPAGTETPFSNEAYRSTHATITANVQVCIDPCEITETNPDSDGDGISDYCDLDDDNDGILDINEMDCSLQNNDTRIIWGYNNGTFASSYRVNSPTETFTLPTDYFSAGGNLTFGSGMQKYQIKSTDISDFEVRDVDQVSFATAKSSNDYMQVSYTPATPLELTGFNLGFAINLYASGEHSSIRKSLGNYKAAIEYASNPAFTSPVLLASNIQIPDLETVPQTAYYMLPTNFGVSQQLTAGTTYYFRIYLYDVQNISNTNPTAPIFANSVLIDDIFLMHRVLCVDIDTDGDGIPDRLDLDSDGDGCFDALEGDENVKAGHLNSDGSISTNAAGIINTNGIASIDANGVPLLVNTGGAADIGGDVGQGIGSSQNASINSCYCTQNPTLGTPDGFTQIGITAQQKQAVWPENIPNGFIALESKTKGFVITRVQNDSNITDPKEGMLIYDIDAQCVKLYNGLSWKCIERSCNDPFTN